MTKPDRRGHSLPAGALTRRDILPSSAPLLALSSSAAAQRGVQNGRIRQSVALWCYQATQWKWSLEKTCQVARSLGCKSIELANPEDWLAIKKAGLVCAIAPNGMADPPFVKGLNNPRYQGQVLETTRRTVDQCAAFGVPNVIAFTGFKWRNAEDPASGEISREQGALNTVRALKDLAGYGERKNVTVCLEMLNTRDSSDPMKGHPGYQGDDIDYCAQIVREVGSTRVKLLFDVYHVQIMHGDVIRRIRQYAGLIGHVHTAGVPGRAELDDSQEINYRAVMRALLEVKYAGYVGQEFIPTRDPERSLSEAVKLCDI